MPDSILEFTIHFRKLQLQMVRINNGANEIDAVKIFKNMFTQFLSLIVLLHLPAQRFS